MLESLPVHCDVGTDAVVLMLSELATNAVLHASTPFDVTVAVAPDASSVRVDVNDGAGGYPVPLEPDADAPHGRGLHIVRTLADAWGIEMRRGQPGKTVWFCASLAADSEPLSTPRPVPASEDERRETGPTRAAAASTAAAASERAPMAMAPTPWPSPSVRAVLDGLRDAVVATDVDGEIHYVNPAAEELMRWRHGSLVGRNALDLVPDSLSEAFSGGFAQFVDEQAQQLVGRKLSTVIRCADGSEVDTELVLSVFDQPNGATVVVGIFRPRDDRKLQRWSELTSELLEILVDAPIDDAPAERLLATLGRRLDWDVTTLWALSADHELVCRHVWTRTSTTAPAFAREKAADPTSGSEGLPRWVD